MIPQWLLKRARRYVISTKSIELADTMARRLSLKSDDVVDAALRVVDEEAVMRVRALDAMDIEEYNR